MFVGTAIFAHVHEYVLIMVCDINALLPFFFHDAFACQWREEMNMVCKTDQDISIFIDFCFCE